MNKSATIGSALVSKLQDAAELGSGQGGMGGVSMEGIVPAVSEQLRQKQIEQMMRPVFSLAEQARKQEAERLFLKLFGTRRFTGTTPMRKGVADFLSYRAYSNKIKPLLASVQAELHNDPSIQTYTLDDPEGSIKQKQRVNELIMQKKLSQFKQLLRQSGWRLGDENVAGMSMYENAGVDDIPLQKLTQAVDTLSLE